MKPGFDQANHRKKLALLLAALLLLGNSLVTAHIFGEPVHVAADNCELLHQFERQYQAPVPPAISGDTPPTTVCRNIVSPALHTSAPETAYRSRAPPFA